MDAQFSPGAATPHRYARGPYSSAGRPGRDNDDDEKEPRRLSHAARVGGAAMWGLTGSDLRAGDGRTKLLRFKPHK